LVRKCYIIEKADNNYEKLKIKRFKI
jgi:hypothetical protein